jgi:hypothetical protein
MDLDHGSHHCGALNFQATVYPLHPDLRRSAIGSVAT